MNVRELKESCKASISKIYEEREADQITDLLIEEYLQLNRVEAVLNSQQEVNKKNRDSINNAVQELIKGKPIDYILGRTSFFGRDFIVDERVLIPRSETEELCQLILEREREKTSRILDIGTGSACIPITLKLEGAYRQVDGCDVSKEALENAKENARDLQAEVNLFDLDILNQFPKDQYDVIVSNPPYVLQSELEELSPHVVEHEPLVALSPIGDPLLFYKRILQVLPKMLVDGGRLYFEIHEDKGEEVEVLMRHYGLKNVEVIEDMYGRDRMAFGVYEA